MARMRDSLLTRTQLVEDLERLGVESGTTVLVHTRMSALGRIVGGAPVVVDALCQVLGPRGTVLVLTGWQDRPPYHQDGWDEAERACYRAACPAFDPRFAHAERGNGRVAEAVRCRPDAAYSRHPVAAFAAVGAEAEWLVSGQSLDEGYGPGSPVHRLVETGGSVLSLGAPPETMTVLHYAEYLAEAGNKRWVEYEMPVLVDGRRTWRRIRELDSSLGAFPYETLPLDDDPFAVLTRSALATGLGRTARIGDAACHLIPAAPFVQHAATWMTHRFGGR